MAKSEYQKKKQQAMSALAKDCLNRLTEMGFGMRELSKMLEGRVSYRTLYRWYNNGPVQRESDVIALKNLYLQLRKEKSKSNRA